jgi:hypothetical protein
MTVQRVCVIRFEFTKRWTRSQRAINSASEIPQLYAKLASYVDRWPDLPTAFPLIARSHVDLGP